MQTIDVTINGETYPCRLTMGAMIRFKEITGHEVDAADGSVRDACAFLYSCIKSYANRNKRRFDMDFMEFCDSVDPEEANRAWESLTRDYSVVGEEGTDEKKSAAS